jgi:hypothetical protein
VDKRENGVDVEVNEREFRERVCDKEVVTTAQDTLILCARHTGISTLLH